MPYGVPRSEESRRDRHKSIYGTEPPTERRMTKFGILEPTGKATITHEIDLSKVKSSDPIAYAYGMVQGERGNPLGKPEKGEKFASEFIRGWNEGHKKFKEKKLKEVV